MTRTSVDSSHRWSYNGEEQGRGGRERVHLVGAIAGKVWGMFPSSPAGCQVSQAKKTASAALGRTDVAQMQTLKVGFNVMISQPKGALRRIHNRRLSDE